MQYTLGMAVFKMSNPDKQNDENAAQLAGLESALRTYEKMVSEKSKAKKKGMDSLLAKRDNQELESLVEKADCSKTK